jgi:hypothetical protein
MARTKAQLQHMLAEEDNIVLALSGKWGTGKTHMWRAIQRESNDQAVKGALNVSLFGAASIADLKMRLVQRALPHLDSSGPARDSLNAGLGLFRKAAAFVHPAGSLISQLAEFAVPALLRKRFIVVDDIERKHLALSTDEILGFIDDFTQNYGCRFLLILNSDKLADAQSWDRYREKVIDQELRLETTPAEAFEIAQTLTPTKRQASIQPAVEACGLTNIRIIRKVIRGVDRILGPARELPEDVGARLIPSTVLLCATHFNGIENGPPMDYILSYDFGRSFEMREKRRRNEEQGPEDKQRAAWLLLLERLGIISVDSYERIVADYLQSGLLDASRVNEVVDRYLSESRLAGAQARARAFFHESNWRPELSDAELVALARGLMEDVALLDCYSVTALSDYVGDLPGGAEVADAMVQKWIDRLRAEAAKPDADPTAFAVDNFFGQRLDPRIARAFDDAHAALAKPRSLVEVCLHLVRSDGWGRSEEAVYKNSSVEEFERAILGASGDELKLFLLKNADMLANRGTYEKHFGAGLHNFLQACRKIASEKTGTRWPKLLRNVFKESKIEALFDQPPGSDALSPR